MKKQICTLALSGLLAIGMNAGSAFAQDNTMQGQGQGPAQGPGHRGGWGNPDEQLARMTRHYNLTADQQTQIKPILENAHQQMEQLHSDPSMSREDKMAKMQSMHQATAQQIEAILTPDQKARFDKDQANMEARRAERMQNNGDAPPSH